MSASWFYAAADGAQGPIGEAELLRLIDSGVIREDTLLWKEGLSEWVPAGQLAVFEQAQARHEPEPVAAPELVQTPRATLRPSPPDPFRRFAARSLDLYIFFLVTPLIGPIDPSQSGQKAVVGVGIYLAWALIEAVLLATLGATPGKWLLRVEVTDAYGKRPDFMTSLRRALDVSVRGMGLGLPIFHVFAQLFGLHQLTGRGITPWDRASHCVVKHGHLELTRWLIFLFLILWIAQSGGGLLAPAG